jgi:hypothetical protein
MELIEYPLIRADFVVCLVFKIGKKIFKFFLLSANFTNFFAKVLDKFAKFLTSQNWRRKKPLVTNTYFACVYHMDQSYFLAFA